MVRDILCQNINNNFKDFKWKLCYDGLTEPSLAPLLTEDKYLWWPGYATSTLPPWIEVIFCKPQFSSSQETKLLSSNDWEMISAYVGVVIMFITAIYARYTLVNDITLV